jgi:site-specific recombinase XerD
VNQNPPKAGAVVRSSEGVHGPADLAVSADTVQRMHDAVPEATRRAYTHDLTAYRDWCATVGRVPIPATPQTFADYATHLAQAGYAPRTIQRAFGAIRTAHRESGYDPPSGRGVGLVIRGHRKARAEQGARDGKAEPVLLDDLRRLVETCDPDQPAGIRDRALIVLGFAMMARRSELVGLDLSDLTDAADGLAVLIRWSKTDQDAVGHVVPVPYGSHPQTCPVRTVRAWRAVLDDRGLADGPLFRSVDRRGRVAGEPLFAGRLSHRLSAAAVRLVVIRAALRAGVDTKDLSAHSLRSGAATEAYRNGADPLSIARYGRWKDGSPVLLGYIRTVDQWRDNPMRGIGL